MTKKETVLKYPYRIKYSIQTFKDGPRSEFTKTIKANSTANAKKEFFKIYNKKAVKIISVKLV